jgi:hypothetical protein
MVGRWGGRVEHRLHLPVQEALVVGILDEPAELRRKRVDQHHVLLEPLDERVARDAVVAGDRRIGDEIRAFEAFGHRRNARVRAGRDERRDGGRERALHAIGLAWVAFAIRGHVPLRRCDAHQSRRHSRRRQRAAQHALGRRVGDP